MQDFKAFAEQGKDVRETKDRSAVDGGEDPGAPS